MASGSGRKKWLWVERAGEVRRHDMCDDEGFFFAIVAVILALS